MRKITRKDGRKVLLATDSDRRILDGRWMGGKEQTRWISMYAHLMRDGSLVIYRAHYSQWQGEVSYIEDYETMDSALVALEGDIDLIEESEIAYLKEHGIDLLADTE